MLIRDTEKRPCVVGVFLALLGVSILSAEGDLDLGVLVAGVAAFGDGVLDSGDFFAGVCAFGDAGFDFGEAFAGAAAFGEGDLDLGDFFVGVGVLGDALFAVDFLGDGVFFFALCTLGLSACSWSTS